MRSSLIYPNVLSPVPTPRPEKQMHRRQNSDESHYSSRSRHSTHCRARSSSPPPKKNVHFYDTSPRHKSRKDCTGYERPKVYSWDAPPIVLSESAKDTARRLYRQALKDGHLDVPQESHRPKYRRSRSSKEVLMTMTTAAEIGTEYASSHGGRKSHSHRYSERYPERWDERGGQLYLTH